MSIHYKAGSEQPPVKPGVMRIYSMLFCPFAQRTRLALLLKDIPYDEINIDLKNKPEWFLNTTPRGLVPVLESNGQVVYESNICNEYLDDLYPDKTPLFPKDPYEKAEVKMLMDEFNKITSLFYKLVHGKVAADERDEVYDSLYNILDKFEAVLQTQFFGGAAHPGALDLSMWPHVGERGFRVENSGKKMIPEDRFPKLNQWKNDMMEVPAVKAAHISPQHYTAFHKSYSTASPDYNMDLTKPVPI